MSLCGRQASAPDHCVTAPHIFAGAHRVLVREIVASFKLAESLAADNCLCNLSDDLAGYFMNGSGASRASGRLPKARRTIDRSPPRSEVEHQPMHKQAIDCGFRSSLRLTNLEVSTVHIDPRTSSRITPEIRLRPLLTAFQPINLGAYIADHHFQLARFGL